MNAIYIRLASALILLAAAVTGVASADVKVSPMFADHMVLQRDMPVAVWGTAGPDEKVSVSFAGQTKQTAADKFRRGFSNTTMGILAIPGQMTHRTREDGYALGLTLGFVEGLGWFVVTELVGVFEFLTCPCELPPRFRPIIHRSCERCREF